MPIDRQATFSGTKDVAGALAIDAARLETLLASRLPDFKGPLRVRQFKGGQSNPTYLLETPARRFVLRRKPPGKLLPSAHALDREFAITRGHHPTGLPVARPRLLCDDARVIGTPFFVTDYVSRCLPTRPA
jgi:aminoglycoside phosphotransferase (APT) family kinase protein